MEDFYITIPYGLLVLAGGVAGYVKRRSTVSLAAGAGFGGALVLAGAVSLWAFAHNNSTSVFATVLQTVCALALMVAMGVRYIKTRKIMPAGIIAIVSALVLIFYVYKISSGGNHVYTPVSAESRRDLVLKFDWQTMQRRRHRVPGESVLLATELPSELPHHVVHCHQRLDPGKLHADAYPWTSSEGDEGARRGR